MTGHWSVAFLPSSFPFFCTNLDQAWLIVDDWQIDYSTGIDGWSDRKHMMKHKG